MNVREVFSPTAQASKLAYRPDIDGLRAIAVLAVVGFHYFPSLFPGGFIGVDVFFVISGYLITGILLRSLNEGTFSVSDFYARRVRRIFPALILVLACSFALGWAILLPTDFAQLGKQIVAGAFFVANFLFWSEAGYFDVSPEAKPLLHLWSLSIEEQFYIVWPWLILFAWKRKLPMAWTIAALVVASFATNIIITARDPVAAFFFPLSRAWELGLGALLACWQISARESRKDEAPELHVRGLSLIGLLMISGSIILLDGTMPFPGWWAAVPVLGTGLIISAGPRAFLNRQLLAHPMLVWLGLISYPLYLWHWVLLSFALAAAELGLAPDVTLIYRIGLVLLSVILAELTYRFVEKPIRFGNVASPVKVAALTASLAIAALMGGKVWGDGGFTTRYPANIDVLLAFDYDPKTDARMDCWLTTKAGAKDLDKACMPEPSKSKRVLIWGDSYSARLYTGLKSTHGENFAIGTSARNGCAALPAITKKCREHNKHVMSMIRQNPPDVVILTGDWQLYREQKKQVDVRKSLMKITGELADAGVNKIIVVGPWPKWKSYLSKILYKKVEGSSFPRRLDSDLKQEVFDLNRRMSKYPWNDRVEYFSVTDVLCNDDGCLTYVAGTPIQLTSYNDSHLTTEAAVFVTQRMTLPE